MNRRDFLQILTLMVPAVFITGCGNSTKSKYDSDADLGSGNDDNGVTSCTTGAGVIYTNTSHAHTTSPLTQLEIDNAVPGDYNLMGGGHPHMVNLTAQDFIDLQNGSTVSKVSDFHGHTVDIACS